MSWRGIVGFSALVALALALGWSVPGGAADEKGKLPPDLARLPADGWFVVSVRPADVWEGELGKAVRGKLDKELKDQLTQLQEAVGITPEQVERLTLVLTDVPPQQPLLALSLRKPYDKDKVIKAFVPGAVEQKYRTERLYVKDRLALSPLSDRVLLVGLADEVKAALDRTEPGKGPLAEVLQAAAGKHTAVVGVAPQTLVKGIPGGLPPEGEAYRPLVKAQYGMLTVDLGERAQAHLKVRYADADEAKAAEKVAKNVLKLAQDLLEGGIKAASKEKELESVVELLKKGQAALKDTTLKQVGSEVVAETKANLEAEKVASMVGDALTRVRQAAARAQGANNLKQIALAFHNYHDSIGHFPPAAVYDKDGKPLLSWRVLILPYVEQNELYKQFKLNEPWDSPNNKKLLAKMPPLYRNPLKQKEPSTSTFYQGFVGPGAVFEGKKGIRIQDITDGTSNTVLVTEGGTAVPWTKPEDLPFKPAGDLPKLGGIYPNGFNAALCDGSVRFFKKTLDEKTLRAMITRNGGEVITLND